MKSAIATTHVGVFDSDNKSLLNRRDQVIHQGLFTQTIQQLSGRNGIALLTRVNVSLISSSY